MNIKSIIILLFAWSYFIGCSGKKEQKTPSMENKVTFSKDNLTPAEQGGYGFEKLSENLGYKSYVWSEEKDKTYFGDPRAKKGG